MRIIALFKRNMKELLRDPLTLCFTIGMPLVLLIIFNALDLKSITPQYTIGQFAPGIAVFSFAFVMLFAGILISTDRTSSFLTRLYSSPIKPYEYILGYTLAMLPIVLAECLLFFGVACIMDSSIMTINLLWTILVLIPISLLFVGFGILFGSLCSDKQVGGVSSVVISASSILNGMWFPEEFFENSAVFDIITRILPFRPAVIVTRAMLAGDFSGSIVQNEIIFPLLIVLGYTIVIGILGILVFRKKMLNDLK